MYEAFYGLNEEPFRLSSDYRFCYGHKSYSRAKAYMQYAFERAEGFVMITGQPGTGKTTLVNELTHTLDSEEPVKIAMLVTTQMDSSDLLRMVAYHFGLTDLGQSKSEVLQQLTNMLTQNHRSGGRALLIIDEAQGLTINSLEELRLLTNLQVDNTPLIQIFLLGQEALKKLIHRPEMEQVHQRLVATCFLKPLELDETKAFVQHRLRVAGWSNRPVISEAVYPVIHKFSQGIPRRINLICSRLFLYGSIEELETIRLADSEVVIGELLSEQLLADGLVIGDEFNAVDAYEPEPNDVSETEDDLAEVDAYQPPVEMSGSEDFELIEESFPEKNAAQTPVSEPAPDESFEVASNPSLPESEVPTLSKPLPISALNNELKEAPSQNQEVGAASPEIRTAKHSDAFRSREASEHLLTDSLHYSEEYKDKDYSLGLILLSVVAVLLIVTMVLFLISPEGFVEQVYRLKGLIDALLA
ncbi:ExeA family protein [Neptunomonas phycophila]|jgi:type II secretory pathway predicted ATPase ExeA|uniref:ExeA family protein n=1 Tax=Neptunomonas phycophila TaxID=1572645 RepID=UPI000948CF21|nr:AAA family ATPase [Neptunomonas phycophila]